MPSELYKNIKQYGLLKRIHYYKKYVERKYEHPWYTTYRIMANKLKTGNHIHRQKGGQIYDYRLIGNCGRNNKKLISKG